MSVDRRFPDDVDLDRPSTARIYDYLLGGFHNFEVDRVAARKFAQILPNVVQGMWVNRAFLRRATKFLVDQGIDQFLDLGSGIPTAGNVHEVAQRANPSARVVYVDNEPVAVRHGETILIDNPNATAIRADLSQPEVVLNHPEVRRLLDLNKPTAVLLLSVLLFVPDDEEAYRAVRTYRDALPSDSYVAISHPTVEGASPKEASPELIKQGAQAYRTPVNIRSRVQVEEFFEGLELVEPGLVFAPVWHPESQDDLLLDQPERSWLYAGVGRKP